MKLNGIRALALAGTLAGGAGLAGCKEDDNIAYIKSQPDVSAALYDSALNCKGRFGLSFDRTQEKWQYFADSVHFSKKADTAIADTAKKSFSAGKQFVLDSLAKAVKAK